MTILSIFPPMRSKLQYLATFGLYVSVQALALWMVTILPADYRAFENPSDPVNPIMYFLLILAMTGVLLLLIKLGKGNILRAVFIGAMCIAMFSILMPLFFLVVPDASVAFVWGAGAAVIIGLLLVVWPEWYVVDVAAFLVGGGATAILGLSLGILPAFILLIILMAYDAISVYKTKHMLTLAEGVVDMRLPVLFVIPKNTDYKMGEEQMDLDDREKDAERTTMMMGVGDAVFPGILIVSARVYLPSSSAYFQWADALVTVGAFIGGCIGFAVLMRYVSTGRPQAGLPLLCGGTIAGYMVSYLLVFQDLSFGF
jgi:presenilin-like A22 family membrane protease